MAAFHDPLVYSMGGALFLLANFILQMKNVLRWFRAGRAGLVGLAVARPIFESTRNAHAH